MKSVFMGKSVAQWLTKNIEYFVVGISSKQFCTFRDGDIAYTLQQSSYSFSNFLFLIELKVGGFRRSVIIPEGRAKNGWRTFGFELRKMLEPNQYAVGGSGLIKFVAQPHRCNSEIQNTRTFAETVQGHHVQVMDSKHPEQLCIKDKGKTQLGEERKVMPKSDPAKVVMSGKLVAKIFLIAVGGGSVKSRSINVDINLGETIPVGNKKRFPLRFNSNSNNSDYGMGSDFRNSCWTGKGLIMEVGEKGKRRVSWDFNKGGPNFFKWVSWG